MFGKLAQLSQEGTNALLMFFIMLFTQYCAPIENRVSIVNEHFVWQNQRAIFVADTAWQLLDQSEEDILFYLDTRQEQGFNAVQFDIFGSIVNNPDASKNKIRWILDELAEREMWGIVGIAAIYQWENVHPWLPIAIIPLDLAYTYGHEVASSLKDIENIPFFYIRALDNDRDLADQKAYAQLLAQGAKDGDPTRLVTQHAKAGRTSVDVEWGLPLSGTHEFATLQSGASRGSDPNYVIALYNAVRSEYPNTPVFNMEPLYDDTFNQNGEPNTYLDIQKITQVDRTYGAAVAFGNYHVVVMDQFWKLRLNTAGVQAMLHEAAQFGAPTRYTKE